MTVPLRCPACRATMHPETRAGVTVDRCTRCEALWFDASELDRVLGDAYAATDGPPESRIPRRGIGTRPCPRCVKPLETAGWTGLVLDRCKRCRGLFVEARELLHMEREQLPNEALTIEARLQGAMVSAGWALLTAQAIAILLLRFMR